MKKGKDPNLVCYYLVTDESKLLLSWFLHFHLIGEVVVLVLVVALNGPVHVFGAHLAWRTGNRNGHLTWRCLELPSPRRSIL